MPRGTGLYVCQKAAPDLVSAFALRSQRSGASGPESQYNMVHIKTSVGDHWRLKPPSEMTESFLMPELVSCSGWIKCIMNARSPVGESAKAKDKCEASSIIAEDVARGKCSPVV